MYWKLRIPLLILVIGTFSGLVQKNPEISLLNTSYFIRSAVFLCLIGIILTIFEMAKINEKKIHFTIGIALIFLGVFIDHLMV